MKKVLFFIIAFLSYLLPSNAVMAFENVTHFDLAYQNQTFSVDNSTLKSWQGLQTLTPNNAIWSAPLLNDSLLKFIGQKQKKTNTNTLFNYQLSSIYEFVKKTAEKINTESSEPILKIENDLVVEFVPPQTGIKIDTYKTSLEILAALQHGKNSFLMTAYESEPLISLSSTNNLGINELIAEGVSTFSGSPKNRRHNITVGVNKFKGLLIKHGEEFSFNKYLGEVDEKNGFLPELVIKKEGTVPEFGGGLCQVSSTVFRAAMNGGFPITQRRNHAYAVQYYSPQGTDATIYPGVVDFKFINDSPGTILIWPYFKNKDTLVFDFYGTKDSRQVTLEKPVQYDKKPDGSMKATWTRIVNKDGEISTSTFKSIYQSPALFHKTEEFATATTTQINSAPAVLQ